MKTVDFYFDFISPFGYLASLRVDAMAEKHGRTARWQSMLLGISVLKVMGMKPLPATPLKGPYLKRDMARYMRRHGITLGPRAGGKPSYPVFAGRAFHWLDAADPDLAKAYAKAALKAYWQDGIDIGTAEAVSAIAAGVGAGREAVLEAVTEGSGDALLRGAIDRSLELGVFGSPFFLIDGEPFFGLEKMELVEEWLATGGW